MERIDVFPTHEYKGYNLRAGNPFPFGVSLENGYCLVSDAAKTNYYEFMEDNPYVKSIFYVYNGGYAGATGLNTAAGGWVLNETSEVVYIYFKAVPSYTASLKYQNLPADDDGPPPPPGGFGASSEKSGGGGGCFIDLPR